MEAEQQKKKILFAGLTILFCAGIFLYAASLFDRSASEIRPLESSASFLSDIQPKPKEGVSEPARVSTLDWEKMQFDACGGEAKYRSLAWWEKFMAHAEAVKYYSDAYIQSELKSVSENSYANPAGTVYIDQGTYCAVRENADSSICAEPVRKLSANDFAESGEGCLSKDGTAFIAVFPGEYMGGGNVVLRYDIKGDVFEVAKKINETTPDDQVWIAPPTSFGKRTGKTIKMFGGTGDAGCGVTTEFAYDSVANTVELTKRCSMCDGEKLVCKMF